MSDRARAVGFAGAWNGWAQAVGDGVWHQVEYRSIDRTAWVPCLGRFVIVEPDRVRDYRAIPPRRCANPTCQRPVEP